jgi:hypothetical protein
VAGEWRGFSANLIKRLLKSLPTPRGSIVVLNAKGEREVSILSMADMKVVACYSAAKESYPRKLTATVPTVVKEQEEIWMAPCLAEVLEQTSLGGHEGAGSSGTAGEKGDEDEKKAEEWAKKVIKEDPEEG